MRSFYLVFALILAGCSSPEVVAEPVDYGVPKACEPLVPYYLKAKNPSREAALTFQESTCNQFAQSPYAKGYRQFTDSTGKWLARSHCAHLGSYKPWDLHWQMSCGIIYSELKQNNNRYPPQNGDSYYCVNRKVAEAEYNGGNWIIWELDFSGGNLMQAKEICGKIILPNGRKRALWACKENYSYFEHISRRQGAYKQLGGEICR